MHGAKDIQFLQKPSVPHNSSHCTYGTLIFTALFTGAGHLSLSWATLIQCIQSHLILDGQLSHHPSFYAGLTPFFQDSSPKPACIFFLQPTCHIPRPSHLPLYHHPNHTLLTVQAMKLLIMQFSPVSCYFFALWPNICLSALFSSTPSLYFCFKLKLKFPRKQNNRFSSNRLTCYVIPYCTENVQGSYCDQCREVTAVYCDNCTDRNLMLCTWFI